MTSNRVLIPLALIAALMLGGCSDQDPAEFDDTGTADEQATSDDDPTVDGGSGSEVPELDPTDLVAGPYEIDDIPGMPDGSTLTVGVHALQVEDDTMLLELYYTPHTEAADPGERWSLYVMNGQSGTQPLLTDRPNLTQYRLIGLRADSGWSMDTINASAASDQTILWWGYFAAPPEGVDTLSLQVAPGHPVLDVPVQR